MKWLVEVSAVPLSYLGTFGEVSVGHHYLHQEDVKRAIKIIPKQNLRKHQILMDLQLQELKVL